MHSRRPGRWLGGFFAVAATTGLAASVGDIAGQGGAWWQYGAVLCLWLALLAFALVHIPAMVNGLLQRIARARTAAQAATAAGRPLEPFLQRTVDPASGIRLPRVLKLLALAFTALAVLLGTVGGGLAIARALFIHRAASADGAVVEMLPQGARHGTPQGPSIRYTAADNVPRTMVSGVETWPPRFSTGDRVAVLYDPSRPAQAYAADGFDLWFVPVLVGGLGAAFMVTALVLSGLAARFLRRARVRQQHLEDVEQIEQDDDRDRNADQPQEDSAHDAPFWLRSWQNVCWMGRFRTGKMRRKQKIRRCRSGVSPAAAAVRPSARAGEGGYRAAYATSKRTPSSGVPLKRAKNQPEGSPASPMKPSGNAR